jgi:hypothetical protein
MIGRSSSAPRNGRFIASILGPWQVQQRRRLAVLGFWQPGPARLSRDLEARAGCYFYFPDWLLERRKCADKAVDR